MNIFIDELKAAGIPTDAEGFKQQFAEQLTNSGFTVNNQSPFSPFWRLQTELVAKPAEQLIERMIHNVMPSSFAMLAKNEYLDIHGQSRGLTRLTAVTAKGQLTFYRSELDAELTIPQGTIVESLPINGRVYQLTLLNDCVFAIGQNEQTAAAQATMPGQAYNLAAGYYVRILADFEGVSVTNNLGWLITAGQDIETDEHYRARIRAAFAQLGSYHVDFVYKNLIATQSGIPYDNIVLEKGAPRGPGTANAHVFLDVGRVSQSIVDSINEYIQKGNHGLADDMRVYAIAYRDFELTATITQHPGTINIKADVETFIRAAFREHDGYQPTRVNPNQPFSFSQLKTELHNQFPQLHSISFDKNQLNLAFWLPKLTKLEVRHG